jgi:hypothetical protein
MRLFMFAAALPLLAMGSGAVALLGPEHIKPVHSEKCLDVAFGSPANGARVIQFSCHEGDNQKWRIEPAGHGMVRLIARHSGKCMDVNEGSLQDRAAIIQFDCHRETNQKFFIESVGHDPADARVRIRAVHSSKCLDVEGGNILDNAHLVQFPCHDQTNQLFRLR